MLRKHGGIVLSRDRRCGSRGGGRLQAGGIRRCTPGENRLCFVTCQARRPWRLIRLGHMRPNGLEGGPFKLDTGR